jgi:hypothetical protein
MRTRRNPSARHLKQFLGADGRWFDDVRDAEHSLSHAHHCGHDYSTHTYAEGYLLCPTPSERENP